MKYVYGGEKRVECFKNIFGQIIFNNEKLNEPIEVYNDATKLKITKN